MRSRKTNAVKAENDRLLALSSAILEADDEDLDVSKIENRIRHKNALVAFVDRNLMAFFYCTLVTVFLLVVLAGVFSTGD
jgi:hypothetical protein